MNGPGFSRDGLALAITETGSGRPMLFQHGLCGTAAQTAEVFPEGIGWRCLTLECRGHGRSAAGPIEAFSLAAFADDLAAFIEARRLAPVVLGGISMGAALAMRLAAKRPDLVRAAVLARPAWLTEAGPENLLPNIAVGELLDRYPPAEALRRFDATPLARRLAAKAPDNLATLRGLFARDPAAITSALLTRISADGPGITEADLERLALPVLVIGTARDAIHPLPMARQLAAAIPGARFVEITSKAVDRPAYIRDFSAALAGFLQDLAP
jgi:pimeloyl-ACP methyl ester carboxylesterase